MDEAQHLDLSVAQVFQEVAGLRLFAPWSAGMTGQADQDRVPPRVRQRFGDLRRYQRYALVTGILRGGVQPEQRLDRLRRPLLIGVRFARRSEARQDIQGVDRGPATGLVERR